MIPLTVSFSQVLRNLEGPRPVCPSDPNHPLVRNGTSTRPVQDGRRGIYVLTIQRYRCRTCGVTDSALPYDCRPYTAHTWAVVLAVGWLGPQAYHWTWARCHQWLADHHIDVQPADPRTVGDPLARRGRDRDSARHPMDCPDIRHPGGPGLARAGTTALAPLAPTVAGSGPDV